MKYKFKSGDIIDYCDEQYEAINNYGSSGRVKENCKDGTIIDPFYWEIYGDKCKLISEPQINFNNLVIYVTLKEKDDAFKYDTWIVKSIDFENKEVSISNGSVKIWRKFDEVNISEINT